MPDVGLVPRADTPALGRPPSSFARRRAGRSRRTAPALEAARTASDALLAVRDRSERSIALVGHEPNLSRLAALLCAGSDGAFHLELKKGAVALLSCDGFVGPGEACRRWALALKILRALDPRAA